MPWTKTDVDAVKFDLPENRQGRIITVEEALKEAHQQAMEIDSSVIVMGEGVDDKGGSFGTTSGLLETFGQERVIDLPIAENGCTGIAIGAALSGLRPIFVHLRMDFMLICMDQIVNHAAKWKYMFNGAQTVPLVIRSIIGRGWGSAAQHSQSIQGMFMQVPGLKIVMPYSAYDAKGLLLESVADDSPVIFIEHRWTYNQSEPVPEKIYRIPFGKGIIRKEGTDVTIAAVSFMVHEALEAAKKLQEYGIEAEVLDMRTIKPFDEQLLLTSVKKTGRLVVADTGNIMAGWSAEIVARVYELAFSDLKSPAVRIGLPDIPTPSSPLQEKSFYPDKQTIIDKVMSLFNNKTL